MAEILFESYYGTSSLGEPYLMHHGIKGQKWGIRRWQNEDGSLTPEGRKHYGYDDDIVLKKGTGVTRYSNEEVLDNKRKYVSLTNTDDMREYDYYAREGFLDLDLSKDIYSYDYELTKDAKVASARQVSDYIVSKYGDKPIKELIKDADSAFSYYGKDFYNKVKNTKLKDIYNYDKMLADKKAGDDDDDDGAYSRAYVLGSGIGNQMKNTSISSDVFKEFSKRGYDAIIDVEDYWGGIAEMPIVMLNPKETMKFVRREDLWNSDMGSPYLMHHGIKGQKWYHRRFQNEDGSLTTLGRLHYGIGKGRKEEGAKELVEAYDKKRKEEKAAAKATKAEVSKEKLLTSGNAKQILENSDMFTNQELQQAVNRLNMKRQLASLEPPKKSIVAVTTGLLNTAGNAMNAITNVKDAYEKMQRAFESDEDKEKRKAKERQEAREEAAEEGYKLALKKHVQEKAKEAMDDDNDSVSSRIKKAIQSKNDDLWPESSKSNSNDVMDRIKQQVEASEKARIVKSINDSVNADNQRRENDAFISKLSSVSNKYESEREAQRQSDKNNAYDRIRKLMDSSGSTSTSSVSSSNSRSDNDSFISKLSSVANQYSSERETKTPSIFERAVGSVATGQSTVSSMPKASLSKRVGNLMSGVSDRASVDRGRELASSNNELLNKSLGFLDDLDNK